MPAILRNDSWEQLNSGFLKLSTGQNNNNVQLPFVNFQDATQRRLLPYCDGQFLLILLCDENLASVDEQQLTALQSVVISGMTDLRRTFTEHNFPPAVANHVQGYRYALKDLTSGSVVASPRLKVSAQTHHSRAAATAVRDSITRLNMPDEEPHVYEVWARTNQATLVSYTVEDALEKTELLAIREGSEKKLGDALNAMDGLRNELLNS